MKDASADIQNTKKLNEEIRRATLHALNLVKNFTEIAKPFDVKPWLKQLPIDFKHLIISEEKNCCGDPLVTIGKEIAMQCAIKNASRRIITLNEIMIAVRPPGGTPDGGPFRFDFLVDEEEQYIIARSS